MKKLLLIITIILSLTLIGCNKSFLDVKQIDSYDKTTYYLDLVLDANDNTLSVEGKIVYVNETKDFDELKVLIYVNSEYNSVPGNIVNFDYFKIDGNDYEVVYSEEDEATIEINLLETLNKDTNALIEFSYKYEYWDHGRNYGDGEYFNTMFFYPFVAKYDDSGWNNDPYTFTGESYYNDIGDYYVSLNVPEEFLIASSGEVLNEKIKGERKIQEIELINGRDFSFSTSSLYHKYEYKTEDRLYEIYSVEELSNTDEASVFKYITDAFEYYEEIIGPYDYNHYTLELGKIYGMESTGIAYCSSDMNEGTIVHEILHQWLYSMIGNDQSDYSFIDESLTTYLVGYYFGEVYGHYGETEYFYYRDSFRPDLVNHWNNTVGQTMIRKVDEYGSEYGYIIYYHGPTLYKYYVNTFLDGDKEIFIDFMHNLYNEYKNDIVTLDELLMLLQNTTEVHFTYDWFILMLNSIQDPNIRPNR